MGFPSFTRPRNGVCLAWCGDCPTPDSSTRAGGVSPPELLVARLAAARERGEAFEGAWPDALSAAVAVSRGSERREWRDVLDGTAQVWQECFERRMAA